MRVDIGCNITIITQVDADSPTNYANIMHFYLFVIQLWINDEICQWVLSKRLRTKNK